MFLTKQTVLNGVKRSGILVLLALGLAVIPNPAAAMLLFDNGAPDLVSGLSSDAGINLTVADDFSFAFDATVTEIQWFGGYGGHVPAAIDDFTVRIFDDDALVPLMGSFRPVLGQPVRVDTGLDQTEGGETFDIYQYTLEIAGEPLLADTPYWLSIQNDTTSSGGNWFWATTAGAGNAAATAGDGNLWFRDLNRFALAFNVSGSSPIPEPSAALVFGMGWIVVSGAIRRRSRG